MSEIWYETNGYGQRIRPVEVDRSTDSSVWVKGRRRARQSRFDPIYPTWDEAKQSLLLKAEQKVASLHRQLEQANGELGNIMALTP